ncbi:MAG: hypothetical protein ACI9Y1_002820 [Lentisphaeria bacterium]|jgi:hypothetical protein
MPHKIESKIVGFRVKDNAPADTDNAAAAEAPEAAIEHMHEKVAAPKCWWELPTR